MGRSSPTLVPRNGHILQVVVVCRISGGQRQKELSLEDQLDNAHEMVADLYAGEAFYKVISTKAKGELLNRPELDEIEADYRSGRVDLFVYDDLSRLIRGGEAARLLGIGVDHGTRSICIEDGIDTAESTWEEDALNACSENVAHNERLSRRIKQKRMNRFKKRGHVAGQPIVGYIVPPNANTYDDWKKDELAGPTIKEGAEHLLASRNCSAVADLFNSKGFSVGRMCRRQAWDGPMVRRFYQNTLLKGLPQRGAKHTVKRHETGKRVSVPNPRGPNYYHAPHLAHLDPLEFDALNALLDAHNAGHGRPKVDGIDPLFRRARKRTKFPGQCATCSYCGREYVWGGNGLSGSLMCNGPRCWHCWNSISFNGALAAEKLVKAICEQLRHLEGFEAQFASMLAGACETVTQDTAKDWDELRRHENVLADKRNNLRKSMAEYGPRPLIKEGLDALDAEERALAVRRYELECRQNSRPILPESTIALRSSLEDQFRQLAVDSFEFGDLMRLLVPEFCVYLVRLCDGGHPLPRAKVKLNLAGTFPHATLVPGLQELFTRELTIDLFEPPQREQIRVEAVRLSEQRVKQRDMSRLLPGEPTQAAISKAILLHRKMQSLGLDSPYVLLLDPPDDYPKLRRHKHSRYEFKALEGYVRPEL